APGVSPNNYTEDLAAGDRARALSADLLGTDTAAVELVPNTSAGLNLVAQGLDWEPGDRVLVPACEFPANRMPWRDLAARGVALDRVGACGDGTFTVEAVERAMTPRTRVVSVSLVQFLSGFRADVGGIAALCASRGAIFCVDAIQGLGALQLDAGALGAHAGPGGGDVLVAAGGHKWLCSMQGLGVVAVGRSLMERLRPVRGWLNGPVDWDDFSAETDALHPDATRFRTGTLPTAQTYALGAQVGALVDVGPDVIEGAVLGHARTLADGLDALGFARFGTADPAHASGIVTVEAPDPEGLHAHLAGRGVAVSMRSRKVRFAPHAHTRPEDVERALDAVAEFVHAGHAAPVQVATA
ncbi:MAG TPA: aminotransferase class V-fold PLP-dependent enzyme, partial [Rubricoccaceae bacterium]